MSKPTFITLTNIRRGGGSGSFRFEDLIRVRADHIAGYGLDHEIYDGKTLWGTSVNTVASDATYFVSEQPEQIDAMLGVTAEPSADDRAARLLAYCGEFISAQRITCPETIAQCDRVIVAAYDFIEGVCDIAGYDARED